MTVSLGERMLLGKLFNENKREGCAAVLEFREQRGLMSFKSVQQDQYSDLKTLKNYGFNLEETLKSSHRWLLRMSRQLPLHSHGHLALETVMRYLAS
ncbi:hypothetical protein TNCV_3753901 [Trichonephila clavipes]|nr:hypothetical protein TNCV_3753901 [Trichonephila clavipes]